MKYLKTTRVSLVSLCITGLLTACGGGGGGEATSADDGNVSLTGSVFAAPVRGATVSISDCNGNSVTAGVTTSSDGSYTFSIPSSDLNNDLCIESDGGTFDDEATGFSNINAGRLSAFIASGTFSTSASVHLTPASTIVHDLVTLHGKSLTEANTLFDNTFDYTPDVTQAPVDATIVNDTADVASRLAGLRAALFSQLNIDLGLATDEQFSMLKALAQDLSDGALDGGVAVEGTSINLPADVLNRYSMAMYKFRNSYDVTNLSDSELGTIPFAKLARSNAKDGDDYTLPGRYEVKYLDNNMAAMNGKTSFTLQVTENGEPVSGLNISLMPVMFMNGMDHGTPVARVTEDLEFAGTYNATVYYTMMSGMGMGYWQLNAMINDGSTTEKAEFYPNVMMAMPEGEVITSVLRGSNLDMIGNMEMTGMDDPTNRIYYLFKEELMPMGDNTYTLKLFIAAEENMMSYAPVLSSTTLNSDTADQLTISAVTVVVSFARADYPATDANNDGVWEAPRLPLTAGERSEIKVRLTILATNAQSGFFEEIKTTIEGDDATFLLTPGTMSEM